MHQPEQRQYRALQCYQRLYGQAGRGSQIADHAVHTKTLSKRKDHYPALGRQREKLPGTDGREG